jgi:hypothetical protein
MMMMALFGATHPAEKFLRPIRASAIEAIGFFVINALHFVLGMQRIPRARRISFYTPDGYTIKIGAINFHPTTGKITLDTAPRKYPERGLSALLHLGCPTAPCARR